MSSFLFLFGLELRRAGDVNGTRVPRNRKLEKVSAKPNLVGYARALNKEAVDGKVMIVPGNITCEWMW